MAKTMTFGVFKVYKGVGGNLDVRPPTTYPTSEMALSAAKTFALVLGGAVAYAQVVEDGTGATEDGVIIGQFGVMADQRPQATAG